MKKGRFILAFAVVLPSFAAGPSTDIIETFDELLEQATWRVGTQTKSTRDRQSRQLSSQSRFGGRGACSAGGCDSKNDGSA